MNLPQTPEKKPHENAAVLTVVDATSIALKEMGRPITNTVLLGALLHTTGWVNLDSILKIFKDYYSGRLLEGNIRCAKRGFEESKVIRYGEK